MQEIQYFAVTPAQGQTARHARYTAQQDKPPRKDRKPLPAVWWFLPSVTVGLSFWLVLGLIVLG